MRIQYKQHFVSGSIMAGLTVEGSFSVPDKAHFELHKTALEKLTPKTLGRDVTGNRFYISQITIAE